LSLPGVNVYIEGGQQWAPSTGMDGEYQIDVPKQTTHLVFSFVGMIMQLVAYKRAYQQ
jgi:hypothetical protein